MSLAKESIFHEYFKKLAFNFPWLQAMVQLTDSGDFMLHNEGRRPMYVSGMVLLSRTSTKLQHNQIIEVS